MLLGYLNEDFSKTNPEFPNPASVGGRNTFVNSSCRCSNLEFCLAATDENGYTQQMVLPEQLLHKQIGMLMTMEDPGGDGGEANDNEKK